MSRNINKSDANIEIFFFFSDNRIVLLRRAEIIAGGRGLLVDRQTVSNKILCSGYACESGEILSAGIRDN